MGPEVRGEFTFQLGRVALFFVVTAMFPGARAGAEMRPYESTHYILRTDVDSELAQDLCQRLDRMYDEYTERLEEFAPPKSDNRLRVYVFANKSEYDRFTRMPNSSGAFIEKSNVLAATAGNGRDELRRTLQHEAFHQFAHYAIGSTLPVWLNEGLAQVFEEGIFTGKGFLLGQVPPQRLRLIQTYISTDQLINFRRMLSMSHEQWNQNMSNRLEGQLEYVQAWAMTHFLIFATSDDGSLRFRARLIDMLRAIHKGDDGMKAFTEAFSDNFDGFQRHFTEYAKKLTPSSEAVYIEHQCVLADLLVFLEARGQKFTSVRTFREFLLKNVPRTHHHRGDFDWDTSSDLNTYFRDDAGNLLNVTQMYFESQQNVPIRDLVCRPGTGLNLRTRFIEVDGKIEHETIFEPD